MQEKLNKMVSTVHHGAIEPEDALRTMHGIAAMLGLELEEELPQKALLVTGMRKKVSRRDVSEAFTIFGEIESVSVTSNQRGFGTICLLLILFSLTQSLLELITNWLLFFIVVYRPRAISYSGFCTACFRPVSTR